MDGRNGPMSNVSVLVLGAGARRGTKCINGELNQWAYSTSQVDSRGKRRSKQVTRATRRQQGSKQYDQRPNRGNSIKTQTSSSRLPQLQFLPTSSPFTYPHSLPMRIHTPQKLIPPPQPLAPRFPSTQPHHRPRDPDFPPHLPQRLTHHPPLPALTSIVVIIIVPRNDHGPAAQPLPDDTRQHAREHERMLQDLTFKRHERGAG